MQLRTRGSRIELIRTVYDPAIKRGRSVLLGTVKTWDAEIPPDLALKLTDSERAQLEVELTKRKSAMDEYRRTFSARDLPQTLARVAEFYMAQQQATAALSDLACRTREEFSKVLAAMCKAGVGRRRNRRKGSERTCES